MWPISNGGVFNGIVCRSEKTLVWLVFFFLDEMIVRTAGCLLLLARNTA